MIMSSKPLLLARALALVVLASTATLRGSPQPAPQGKAAAQQPPANKSAAAAENSEPRQGEGERIFAQNCSRCHNSPDGFSSRISGTVLRHMRVRASLSKHDEEELLRFFNP